MKKIMILLLCAGLTLSGCAKNNSNTETMEDFGNLIQPEGGVVWEQHWEEWDEAYTDQELYPFSETVNGGLDREENTLKFYFLLNQTISKEEASAYATEVIKGYNDLVCEQNSSYTLSTDDSYGSYVEQYNIYVMVGEDGSKSDPDSWIIEDTIPAGEYREVGVQ